MICFKDILFVLCYIFLTTEKGAEMDASLLLNEMEAFVQEPRTILFRFYGLDERFCADLPESQSNGIERTNQPGTNILENVRLVRISSLIADLRGLGFRVIAARWFLKKNEMKRIIELVFEKEGEAIALPDEIENLFNTVWGWINIWMNMISTGRLDSINVSNPWDEMAQPEKDIVLDLGCEGQCFSYQALQIL